MDRDLEPRRHLLERELGIGRLGKGELGVGELGSRGPELGHHRGGPAGVEARHQLEAAAGLLEPEHQARTRGAAGDHPIHPSGIGGAGAAPVERGRDRSRGSAGE